MTITLKKDKKAQGLIQRIKDMTGSDLNVCYQCKKCTSGCPVSKLVKVPPSEIIRRLQFKGDNELLETEIIWMCVSCETCTARCPMGIEISAVMDALRVLALEKQAVTQEGNVPLFNKALLRTVKYFGRTYDLAMIGAYKMGTLKLMNDSDKFSMILKKRKISLLPSLDADRKIIRRIFKKAKERKDASQ